MTVSEVINFVALVVAVVVTAAVPLLYSFRANLRDPLARAVLAGTGATALTFTVVLILTVGFHLGWSPDTNSWHWISGVTYLSVALGKGCLLVALLRVLRDSGEGKSTPTLRGTVEGVGGDE